MWNLVSEDLMNNHDGNKQHWAAKENANGKKITRMKKTLKDAYDVGMTTQPGSKLVKKIYLPKWQTNIIFTSRMKNLPVRVLVKKSIFLLSR